jgi:3-isopropylmalate/(R)-2-methylmalate dehydratase large subunit
MVRPASASGGRIGDCKGLAMNLVISEVTNGRIDDFKNRCENYERQNVKIRTIIVQQRGDLEKAMKEKLFDVFYEAGCVISAPTCGACLGGFMGILAAGERCVSTTNRNFVGRMGHPKSEVYLASPATAAASAIEGKLTDCRKYMK